MSSPLLVEVLHGRPVPRPPVWLMRQAGRYLPQYRALKQRHSFLEMCRSPSLAVEATLQPIEEFDVDAAILFSDILIPTTALGFEIDFAPGPVVKNLISTGTHIEQLNRKSLESLSYVGAAVTEVRSRLEAAPGQRKALLGFAGAPWTLACYLIDQGVFKHFQGTQVFAQREPEAFSVLLQQLSELVGEYLLMQCEAGADAVQLFDSWGGMLCIEDYRRWSLPTIKHVTEMLHRAGRRVILYTGNAGHLVPALIESGADALSLDWRMSLADILRAHPDMIIQGNLDPTWLFAPAPEVERRTRAMLDLVSNLRSAKQTGYIANLGHGVLQQTPVENVRSFVRQVQAFQWKNL